MNLKDKLRLMTDSERKNQENIKAFVNQRKPTFQPRRRKPKRNRGKPKK